MRRKASPPVYFLDDDNDRTTSDQHRSDFLRTISSSVSLKRKKSNEIHSTNIAHGNPTHFARIKKQTKPKTTVVNIQPILIDSDQTDEDDDDPSSFYRAFDWTTDFEQPSANRTLLRPSLFPPARVSFISDSALNNTSNIPSNVDNSSRSQCHSSSEPISLRDVPALFVVKEKTLSNSSTIKPKEKSTTDRSTFNEKSVSSQVSTVDVTESKRNLGQFPAFYDSKHYRCNMCQFKSVTSSTLLQHVLSHLFVCDHCSFFTFTQWEITQHQFQEHRNKLTKAEIHEHDPKSSQFFHLTRSKDGTFALCANNSTIVEEKLDDRPDSIVKSRKVRRIPKERPVSPQFKQTAIRKRKTKHSFGVRFLEKDGIHYILKGVSKNNSLTLEYKRCRELMIRTICENESNVRNQNESTQIQTIDEVAQCIRTVVNRTIVDDEKRSDSTLISTISQPLVPGILPNEDFSQLFESLKLCNRSQRATGIQKISEKDTSFHFDDHHKIILVPIDRQEKICKISALSSKTERSAFVQAKPKKLPTTDDNVEYFLDKSSQNQTKKKTKPPSRSVQHHSSFSTSHLVDVSFEQNPKSNSPEEAINVIVID